MSSNPLEARETGFLNRKLSIGSTEYKYQVYVPADWSKKEKWPVILFLHGAGERGDDGMAQTEVGIGRAIRLFPDRFRAVIIMPQCRKGVWWTDTQMQAQALEALHRAMKEFNGDARRVYLTGISMGGYGSFAIAAKHPTLWAAIAPICGGVVPPRGANIPGLDLPAEPYKATAEKIGKTPVWIFHGAVDSIVPVTESQKMNEALKAAGGVVQYTEYPGVDHNSWDKAYADPELIRWMLAQRR
jgi:predicted peptidase